MKKVVAFWKAILPFLSWATQLMIAYWAARSLVDKPKDCLALALVFYWTIEGIDEIRIILKRHYGNV